MNALPACFDNPIFVKHLRSRLRKSQFYSSAVVVLVLCFLDAYAGWWLNWYSNHWAYGMLVGLQTILLVFIGASQVAASVGGARESGILDFHRVSPLSPLAVTLGFFFGAPIREYALFGITIPFALACVYFESLTMFDWLQSTASLILGAWVVQSFSLLVALMAKKPKAAGGMVVGMMIFIAYGLIGVGSSVLQQPAGGVDPSVFGFFGFPMPWLALVALYALPAIFFFMLASTRKMQSDRAHPYAKREAVAFLAVEAVLLIGGGWAFKGLPAVVFVVLYVLIIFGCILTVAITPKLGEYAKGIRRAKRRGIRHLGYWDDHALNRVSLAALCLVVLIGATLAWYLIAGRPITPAFLAIAPMRGFSYGIPIATGVLVVAYFGLALQYVYLVAPKRGTTILGLFLFFVWFMPLVIAMFVGLTSGNSPSPDFVAALSPIAGLVLSSQVRDTPWVEGAALVPALVFTFLFNNLVTLARRRIIKAIDEGRDGAKPTSVPDPLAGDESDLILV